MNKRSTVFIIVLMLFLAAYLYSCCKMVVFNHSDNKINAITIETEFLHRELKDIDTNKVMKFTLFSPFDKSVRIKIKQPGRINSIKFNLEGFFPNNNQNQVEITPDGTIKHGALGLER